MTTLLATIIILSILIFVHEFGHFLTAKLSGMRVERFSMGLPPRMIGKKIGETDYCLSWIPFGGYVKISGMVDETLDKNSIQKKPEPREFRSKPWISRVLVISAGSLMNIIFAFILFIVLTLSIGVVDNYSSKPIVGNVMEGKPAAKAGIKSDDLIVSIEGEKIETWDQLTDIIYASPGKELNITYERNEARHSVTITPVEEKIVVNEQGDIETVGLIGIERRVTMRSVGIFSAIGYGVRNTFYITRLIAVSLYKLITGQHSIKSLGGPIAISKMAGESARGGLTTFFGFMAMLSLNLGILNLLPIPVLDGGHLVYLIIEGIIGKEIPAKVKLVIQQVGMVLLLALMIFVIYNDLFRLFSD
ncbi:MAG: RIP metalloprotease RseP [bacterium]